MTPQIVPDATFRLRARGEETGSTKAFEWKTPTRADVGAQQLQCPDRGRSGLSMLLHQRPFSQVRGTLCQGARERSVWLSFEVKTLADQAVRGPIRSEAHRFIVSQRFLVIICDGCVDLFKRGIFGGFVADCEKRAPYPPASGGGPDVCSDDTPAGFNARFVSNLGSYQRLEAKYHTVLLRD